MGNRVSIRVLKYSLTGPVASFGATIAATMLYFVVVFHETPDLFDGFFWGLQPGLRGIVLAVPAAIAFSFFRPRVNRVVFVAGAAAAASVLGALLGFWVAGNSPHISAQIAAELLALTWAIAAILVSLLAASQTK